MLSKEEEKYLKQIYKGRLCKDIANIINKKFDANHNEKEIERAKKKLGLRSGIDCTFKKGHETFNKGKKWDDYLTKEQQEKAKKTCFKKGHKPKQHREIGSERITIDGYLEVKVAEPNKWALKHRLVYEEAYGKIPKGMKLVFADGNKLNLDLDNLLLVTDKELLLMNAKKLIKEDKELTKSGLALTKLMNKMYENGLAEMNKKEYQKEYREKNIQKIKEYQKEWYKKKKEANNGKN